MSFLVDGCFYIDSSIFLQLIMFYRLRTGCLVLYNLELGLYLNKNTILYPHFMFISHTFILPDSFFRPKIIWVNLSIGCYICYKIYFIIELLHFLTKMRPSYENMVLYILFKLLSIASHYFFLASWQHTENHFIF